MVDMVIDSTEVEFTFDAKYCPMLNIDDLFWIGMHDVNRNGEHKWATGNFPLPLPLQWYRDRPAKTGNLRGLIFFNELCSRESFHPQENVSIWILKESGRVETAEQHRFAMGGSMQSARDQKRWSRVQLKTLKRPPVG